MIRITVKVDDHLDEVHEAEEYILLTGKHVGTVTEVAGSLTCTENFKRIAYFELMQGILEQVSEDRKAGV